MEGIKCEISAEKFDRAIRNVPGEIPVLAEGGDLAVYVKPKGTVEGKACAVITFTVQLPDGTKARAQATTTAALLKQVGLIMRGWEDGGHI